MKNMLAILMALLVALSLGNAGKGGEAADTGAGNEMLTGRVLEVSGDYFLLETKTHGTVQVNYGGETVFEGVDAKTLAAGQFAVVDYDGKMTRSLPGQVFGLRVGVYALQGRVAAVAADRFTLVCTDSGEEVIVTLGDTEAAVQPGDDVIVYTTGVAALSLPAQVNAIGVVKP